jgi:8-oxo-dGTP pyrophosphatase MutT (NUDIX family)
MDDDIRSTDCQPIGWQSGDGMTRIDDTVKNIEYVDIIDDSDKVIGLMPRSECDAKNLRRRASRVLIYNSEGVPLLLLRELLRPLGGLWEFGMGESVTAGESYLDGAVRGLWEELKIERVEPKYCFKFNYSDRTMRRCTTVYCLSYDGKILIDPVEIKEARFIDDSEMSRLLDKGWCTLISTEAYFKYEKTKKSAGTR